MYPQRPSEFLVGWEEKWKEISEFQPSFQGLGVRCPSPLPQASIEQTVAKEACLEGQSWGEAP